MQKLHTMPQLKESLKGKRKFYCNFYLELDCFIAPCPPGEGAAKKKYILCDTVSFENVLNAAQSVTCCTERGKEGPASAPKPSISSNQDSPIPSKNKRS